MSIVLSLRNHAFKVHLKGEGKEISFISVGSQHKTNMRGDTKTLEFIYKKLYIHSYMFKLQSFSQYCPFDATHLLRHFFHCSKPFLNSSILMPFSASGSFCFTSSTSAKVFPLDFFYPGKQKSLGARLGEQRGQGMKVVPFWVKNCQTVSAVWAGVLVNHPYEMGKHTESVQKEFTASECSLSQQRQLVHGYRWVPRTLTYQRKLGLQGALPPENNSVFWGGSPLYTSKCYTIILTQDYLQQILPHQVQIY